MNKKLLYYISIALVLASCNSMDTTQNNSEVIGARITIPVDGASQSRAHFSDNNDGTAGFVWDENSDVVTSVKHDNSFVRFYNGIYYSYTTVKNNSDTEATLTTEGLLEVNSGTDSDGNIIFTYPVKVDDPVFCFSPVNSTNGSTVDATSDAVSVKAKMPQVFTQTASSKLDEFKDYSYIYTNTIINKADENDIKAKGATFKSAGAVLRFCLTDNTDTDIKLSSIKMESQDGSAIFPNQLIWTAGNETPIEEPTNKDGYYNYIQVITGESDGVTIQKDGTSTFYMYVLPFNSVSFPEYG